MKEPRKNEGILVRGGSIVRYQIPVQCSDAFAIHRTGNHHRRVRVPIYRVGALPTHKQHCQRLSNQRTNGSNETTSVPQHYVHRETTTMAGANAETEVAERNKAKTTFMVLWWCGVVWFRLGMESNKARCSSGRMHNRGIFRFHILLPTIVRWNSYWIC
jgi:hypothetical protein